MPHSESFFIFQQAFLRAPLSAKAKAAVLEFPTKEQSITVQPYIRFLP